MFACLHRASNNNRFRYLAFTTCSKSSTLCIATKSSGLSSDILPLCQVNIYRCLSSCWNNQNTVSTSHSLFRKEIPRPQTHSLTHSYSHHQPIRLPCGQTFFPTSLTHSRQHVPYHPGNDIFGHKAKQNSRPGSLMVKTPPCNSGGGRFWIENP